jgi:prevent-host-death family protein
MEHDKMERVVGATEARIRFGELMRRVAEQKTCVIVERGGKPWVVVLTHHFTIPVLQVAEPFEDLRLNSAELNSTRKENDNGQDPFDDLL